MVWANKLHWTTFTPDCLVCHILEFNWRLSVFLLFLNTFHRTCLFARLSICCSENSNLETQVDGGNRSCTECVHAVLFLCFFLRYNFSSVSVTSCNSLKRIEKAIGQYIVFQSKISMTFKCRLLQDRELFQNRNPYLEILCTQVDSMSMVTKLCKNVKLTDHAVSPMVNKRIH